MSKRIFTLTMLLLVAASINVRAQLLQEEISIAGFIDGSAYSSSDNEDDSFGIDLVSLEISKGGDESLSGFLFSIEIEAQSEDASTVKVLDNSTGEEVDVSTGEDAFAGEDLLGEGFVWFKLGGTKLTFGKFDAPIGFEGSAPPDMWQYSSAMITEHGQPGSIAGLMFSGSYSIVDYRLYYVNGWDLVKDDNKKKSIGGRIGLTPTEKLNIGFSYITGKEGEAEDRKYAADIDLTYNVTDSLLIGAEYNLGSQSDFIKEVGDSPTDANWNGFLIMCNYSFNDKIGLTVRYDQLEDEDQLIFDNDVAETRKAVTIAPSYRITENLSSLFEYKSSSSDYAEAYEDSDGTKTDKLDQFAIELTYEF